MESNDTPGGVTPPIDYEAPRVIELVDLDAQLLNPLPSP